MSNPIQPPVTIETPYGVGVLRDSRHYNDKPNHYGSRELATVHFEKLTVNRKEYSNVRFSVKPGWGYDDAAPFRVHDDTYRAGLTDSARDKVGAALLEHADKFAPYLEELDAATVRSQIKDELASKIRRAIGDVAPNHYHKGPDFQLREDLIAEVLAECIARHDTGLSWSEVYYNDTK